MRAPGLQGDGVTTTGGFDTDGTDCSDRPHPGPLPQERGKWFLRLDVFGDDGFAVAVVEPEARYYTKMNKKAVFRSLRDNHFGLTQRRRGTPGGGTRPTRGRARRDAGKDELTMNPHESPRMGAGIFQPRIFDSVPACSESAGPGRKYLLTIAGLR